MALKAPRNRLIHRESRDSSMSCDEDEGSENANLEEGLSFFDSFQETPKHCANNSTASSEGSFDSGELALNEAINGALVGENVLDSPNAPRKKTSQRILTTSTYKNNNSPPTHNNNNNNAASSSQSSSRQSPSHDDPNGPGSLSDMSVGLIYQGFAWIRGQRDDRRRKTLQMQAEEQAQKIRDAQLAEKLQHDGSSRSRSSSPSKSDSPDAAGRAGLESNPTFQSLAHMIPQSASAAATCGSDLNGVSEGTSEYFDAQQQHTQHSSGGASGGNSAGGGSDAEDDIIQKTEISRSGDGYVVEFAVPDQREEDMDWVPPVRVAQEPSNSAPYILSEQQRQLVAQHVLPTGIAYAKWKRLYSLARDGDSFDACLRLITGHAQTLMVVRTAANDILGGFADYSWDHPTIGGTQYFGGPTACLYSFARTATANDENREDSNIQVYKWTGANRYIQLCDREHKMLAFGGGGEDGEFGLAVAQDFQHGSSGPCDTFGNVPLSSSSSDSQFEIVDLEIYSFLLGQF